MEESFFITPKTHLRKCEVCRAAKTSDEMCRGMQTYLAELKALSLHTDSCPLCQSKGAVTVNDEKEHDEWIQKYKTHISKCSQCKSAKEVEQMCEPIASFITQDHREITGTRYFPKNYIYELADGSLMISERFYVDPYDFQELEGKNEDISQREVQVLQAISHTPYDPTALDIDEYFSQKLPKKMKKIFQLLVLGYKVTEIAEIIGVHRDTIYEKIKKIPTKQSTLPTPYSRGAKR